MNLKEKDSNIRKNLNTNFHMNLNDFVRGRGRILYKL